MEKAVEAVKQHMAENGTAAYAVEMASRHVREARAQGATWSEAVETVVDAYTAQGVARGMAPHVARVVAWAMVDMVADVVESAA